MTNSYNDIRNSKTLVFLGGNPAEAHPVSLAASAGRQGTQSRELCRHRSAPDAHGGACDRICAHTPRHQYPDDLRACSGTSSRTAGRTRSSSTSASMAWTTSARKSPSGRPKRSSVSPACPERSSSASRKMFAKQRPATLIWAMGQTQHAVGTANVRASCILLLATGNVGGFGNGANIFRGHCNVQGATDLGLDITTLPRYYGLAEGAWRHWSRVWEVDYSWFEGRFDTIPGPDGKPVKMINAPGIPSHALVRCGDDAEGSGLTEGQCEGDDASSGMVATPSPECRKPRRASKSSNCWSCADPHPTTWAALSERKNGTYLLPICTQFESIRLAHGVEPLDPVGRTDRQADLRIEERLRGDVSPRQEARFRRPDVQEHQGREQRSLRRRTSCARSIAVAGRPAIAVSRRSA